MAVINVDGPVEDGWRRVTDANATGGNDAVIVTLAVWQANRSTLSAGTRPIGLQVPNDVAPDALAAALEHVELIELTFPKFSDGRAYSQARTLRENLGFTGEIRAAGNFGRDQLAFLVRCGFDSFIVPDSDDWRLWLEALGEVDVHLQPAADRRPGARHLRAAGQSKFRPYGTV